jgi:hypothetical protein
MGSYILSQNRTYNAAIRKKPAITPIKIKSLINLERTGRRSTAATCQRLPLSDSKKPWPRHKKPVKSRGGRPVRTVALQTVSLKIWL